MTERQALVVRGGWEGHQPVEATDLFLPFLEDNGFAVRVEDSPEVYADAAYMAGDRPDRAVHDDVADRAGPARRADARRSRPAPGSPAGTAGSPTPTAPLRLPAARRRAVRLPPGQGPVERTGRAGRTTSSRTRVDITEPAATTRSPRASRTSSWTPSSTGCSPTTTSTSSPPPPTRVRPWEPWHRPVTSPGDLDPRSGAPGRSFVTTPGHNLDVLENPNVRTIIERGMLWASALKRRRSSAPATSPAQYLRHARPAAAAARSPRSPTCDAARAAAVAAERRAPGR